MAGGGLDFAPGMTAWSRADLSHDRHLVETDAVGAYADITLARQGWLFPRLELFLPGRPAG